jgi:leucyl aminopeptidase
MKFQLKSDSISKLSADIIILAINKSNKLCSSLSLSKPFQDDLNLIIKLDDLSKDTGSVIIEHMQGAFKRVCFVRIQNQDSLSEEDLLKLAKNIFKAFKSFKFGTVALPVNQFVNKDNNEGAVANLFTKAAIDASYEVNSLKSDKKVSKNNYQINFQANKLDSNFIKLGIKEGQAIAEGMNLTKDLGNLPPNICTPTYLANQAKKIAKDFKMKSTILSQKQIEQLKMGSFLSVAKGSRLEPKFIIIEHKKGKKSSKPVVLVGKGITFDSGGISLKPGAAMDEMKYDMCGAATVLGVMKTIGLLNLPLNVVGLIPACENMPDGLAVKPGDIVTSMSGQTIEILNTDAEGRLVLCDALTYAERYKPESVIDIATLTGACVIALGHHASAVFSKSDDLANDLLEAGNKSIDKAWRMPLWDEYQPLLNSNFADIANIGGRAAGSITAACFLSRFTKKYSWAHIDIAGTAWNSGANKGATGRPVSLLCQFLIHKTKK